MTIRDETLIPELFALFGRETPRKALQIELTVYGGIAGYRIDVVERRRVVISLAWCPMIRRRTHVLRGLTSTCVDVTALDALVAGFLDRHHHGMLHPESFDLTMAVIGDYGRAVADGRWRTARQLWAALKPLHAWLTESNPSLAFVDTVLALREAADGPCASGSVH